MLYTILHYNTIVGIMKHNGNKYIKGSGHNRMTETRLIDDYKNRATSSDGNPLALGIKN